MDRAFAAVHAGDCLDVYNDGHDNMSADRPIRVNCAASNAYMHVNRVSTRTGASSSCDTGAGFTWWNKPGHDGITRTLCLDRVYRAGQCFPADVTGGDHGEPDGGVALRRVDGAEGGSVDPADHRLLPGPRRRAGTGPAQGGPGARFWYWQVNQGRSIICASAADPYP
ncbi:hypothetical protein GTV15_06040 [Streptomyces sp. SID7803]|nr:hypothetical protein [Streptomyces sp. SID7803]